MLSAEQQSIIENSLWVVNTALKNQGLGADEDLRQSAILYMCGCLERFDTNRNVQWTTFAYKNVYLYIKRTHAQDVKRQDKEIHDDILYLSQASEAPTDELRGQEVDIIKNCCSTEEKHVIDLKLQGYNNTEISRQIGCSVSKVSRYMKSIKLKAQALYPLLN